MKTKKQMRKTIAYEHIKGQIIRYELTPGSDISEAELSEALQMSRTPVREAILQLEQEGYVQIYPHKGIFVTHISYEEMYELYQVRLFFELPCIPHICRQAQESQEVRDKLAEMYTFFTAHRYTADPDLLDEWTEMDRRFHRIVIDSYGNQQFSLLYDTVVNKIKRIRYLLARNIRSRTEDAAAEHLRIIDAILAGDENRAREELTRHIDVPTCLQVAIGEISPQSALS